MYNTFIKKQNCEVGMNTFFPRELLKLQDWLFLFCLSILKPSLIYFLSIQAQAEEDERELDDTAVLLVDSLLTELSPAKDTNWEHALLQISLAIVLAQCSVRVQCRLMFSIDVEKIFHLSNHENILQILFENSMIVRRSCCICLPVLNSNNNTQNLHFRLC